MASGGNGHSAHWGQTIICKLAGQRRAPIHRAHFISERFLVVPVERTLGECLTVTVHSKSVDLSLSLLATLQLLRRFCFGLRASSSNVHQPASLRIHRQGRNTGYSAKEHPHTHTRCKTQPKSQRWCSTTQTARWYIRISFQTNANLITLHWRHLI